MAPTIAAFLVTLASLPIRNRIEPTKLVALFPRASYAVTWTGGLIVLSCIAALGGPVNSSWVAGPGTTLNVPLESGSDCGAEAVGLYTQAPFSSSRTP